MTVSPRHMLKALRNRAKLTQAQVAEAIQIDRSYYSRIESGARDYDQTVIEKLADFYRCEPYELLLGKANNAGELWNLVSKMVPDDRMRLLRMARALTEVTEGDSQTPDSATIHEKGLKYDPSPAFWKRDRNP